MKNSILILFICTSVITLKSQEMVTEKLTDKIYTFTPGNYVYVTAMTGEEGTLLVDLGHRETVEQLSAGLKKTGCDNIKYIIITHFHSDHTGGKEKFDKNAVIISHKTVKKRLSSEQKVLEYTYPPKPDEAQPDITFEKSMTIYFNGEPIKLIHMPGGHTDGDCIVYFTKSKVLSMSDLLFTDNFPFVDLVNGGNAIRYIQNIKKIIEIVPEDVKIVPGHGSLYTIEDLKRYCKTLSETVDLIRNKIQEGKNLSKIQEEGLPDKYNSYGEGFIDVPGWIEIVYKSIQQDK